MMFDMTQNQFFFQGVEGTSAGSCILEDSEVILTLSQHTFNAFKLPLQMFHASFVFSVARYAIFILKRVIVYYR